ncbi:LacI family DNA-binding transcriptional regulator [Spirochaeta isovalerica]|uniref:LacI family transcriptional regulator n=1 Tax=Spirochaeta isovalerica TaxID=150 RepID=A0A841R5B7_9SPIO|nr:LacI family DNA-binding transcriptional regulator [Spirochaeta isovalerica]MBB6478581.1 LacI family transcriptional regulator [Spirochaeta isovalerica]
MSIEGLDKKEAVTIYDVAEKAGISIATVSRVLNRPEKVSPSTREKVFSVMKALGFTPKAEARERARKEVGRIGVITPYFTHPSFVHRLRGISEGIRGAAYELVIISLETLEEVESYLQSPGLAHRLDGLIVLSRKFESTTLKLLKEKKMPTVFVEFGEEGFSGVCIDNIKGGEMAADFLLQSGYKSFSVLTENEQGIDVHPNVMRVDGFRQALNRKGMVLSSENIGYGSNDMAQSLIAAEELLRSFRPEAVFATTDFLAVAVIKIAKKLDISIPEEMGLLGFDGTNTSDYMDFTTVDQSLEESGKLAVELLLKRIKSPQSPVQTIYLPLRITERRTTTRK